MTTPIAILIPAGTGRLNNGNPPGDLRLAPRCGARARVGHDCRQPAMANGRCRFHGGRSTGPRTAAGRERCRRSQLRHGRRSHAFSENRAGRVRSARCLRALRAAILAEDALRRGRRVPQKFWRDIGSIAARRDVPAGRVAVCLGRWERAVDARSRLRLPDVLVRPTHKMSSPGLTRGPSFSFFLASIGPMGPRVTPGDDEVWEVNEKHAKPDSQTPVRDAGFPVDMGCGVASGFKKIAGENHRNSCHSRIAYKPGRGTGDGRAGGGIVAGVSRGGRAGVSWREAAPAAAPGPHRGAA